jgi:hypothetical protein
MNKYLIILVVIIILLCIFYIIYRNNEYNKLLESFSSGNSYSMPLTQSSLSTYYQPKVDLDTYNISTYSYNKVNPQDTSSQLNWNAIWKGDKIYAQFLQNNDKLIIAITKSEYIQNNISSNQGCYSGSFVGIGQLNQNRDFFILKSIICNNLVNENLNLNVEMLSGKISINSSKKRQITLYSSTETKDPKIPITLDWVKDFSYTNGVASNNSFTNNLISNVTQFPFITEEDKYVMDSSYPCPNLNVKCDYIYPNKSPSDILGYTGKKSCASSADASGKCVGSPTCYVSSNPNADGIQNGNKGLIFPCGNIVNDYMNFMPIKGLVNMSTSNNNTLKLCDYLSNFSQDKCNVCIIGYVDKLGIFRTLNYEFFGVSPDKSNLTLQTDMMNNKLNSSTGIINYYRTNYITTINNSLKFTNCLENNSTYNDPKTMMNSTSTCYNTLTNYKNNYIPIQDNLDLYPLIWQLNTRSSYNILNSCGVYINSHPDYPVSQKFIEYSDKEIYLSPNGGGLNQQLLFDNVNIIRDMPSSGSKSIILTTNIKTLNNLYLLPSVDKGFPVNTSTVKLASKPDPNGKWLVIGFTLSNLNNLTSVLSNLNYNSTNN